MSPQLRKAGRRPVLIAHCLFAAMIAVAVLAAATAHAAQYKMVACASSSGAPPYATETNTVTANHPNGIFDFNNYCGGAGGDPPGDSAFLRISEHEPSGNAGQGSFGRFVFATPAYVHFRIGGGYTREPNAFNAGWLTRFRVTDFSGNTTTTLNQGAGLPNSGLDWATSGIFGPHLWPFGSPIDFHHFYYELVCNLPGGCDRANFNAVDANAFVFVLNDDQAPDLYFLAQSSDLMQGKWVSGAQWTPWYIHDNGSGIRNERIRIDGAERYLIDHQALGECNATSSQVNGEFSRNFQPCPQGPYWHDWTLDTASTSDGAHTLQVCAQDYGQYRGLNGTGGETCDGRTIHVDNHPPGVPVGLQVTSANPNRYLDHFDAAFSLPPDPGSPIVKAHYEVVDATGKALGPEATLSGTNPTAIPGIVGPAQAGEYRLKVWLEDAVGHVGPAAFAPIPHDTTPPAAPQDLSVTPPTTSRTADGFDVRWRDVVDQGSPIDEVHYQLLNAAGSVVVPTQTIEGSNVQAIRDLETAQQRGDYTLRVWLEDAEGNVGVPSVAPLAYECVRSTSGGGTALSSGLGENGAAEEVVEQGEGSIIRGRLTGPEGGIGEAPVCVFSRVTTQRKLEFLGLAVTAGDGGYRFAIPAGPSRELSVAYRSGSREVSSHATLQTIVHPTFNVRKKVIYNKHYAKFTGTIPGPENNNVVVVAQVHRGKGWLAYHRYRTRDNGEVTLIYKFNKTYVPTKYRMRLQVRSQSGYPYLQGNSDELTLIVLPKRAHRPTPRSRQRTRAPPHAQATSPRAQATSHPRRRRGPGRTRRVQGSHEARHRKGRDAWLRWLRIPIVARELRPRAAG